METSIIDSSTIIISISLLIILAPFLSKVTFLPIVVVEIVLGALGGYFGFFEESEILSLIAHVGFLYLMFLAGMEVDLHNFKMGQGTLLKRTVVYFVMLYTLSFVAYLYFDLSAVYLVAFPIFSLGILMALVKEYGKDEAWLSLALNIGIIGELVSILAITILSGGLEYGYNMQFLLTMLWLVLFLAVFILVFKGARVLFWWFPGLKLIIMPYRDTKDTDIRLSMSLMFIMVAVMLIIRIDAVLGAFLAGLFITTFFKHKTELPKKLSSFGFGFLVPIFFIHVGSTLPINAFVDKEVLSHALFIASAIVTIRLISSLVAYRGYLGFKNTILFSLSDSMPLTFLVAIATLGLHAKAISPTEYYAFVVASMLSAVVLMVVIKILHRFFKPA
jgi:Kef-type K+ transport system membrane component KefB